MPEAPLYFIVARVYRQHDKPHVLFGLLFLCSTLLVGCQCGGPEIDISGDHPYGRCSSLEPQAQRLWTEGGFSFELSERALTITSAADEEIRVLAIAEPLGDLSELSGEVSESEADFVWVFGGLGASVDSARQTLELLHTLAAHVFYLAGATDTPEVLREVFADAPQNVVHISVLRTVVLGGAEWIPVAGGPAGRYGRGGNPCGFDTEELAGFADDFDAIESTGPSRHLLSWTAPAGQAGAPIAAGLFGVDAGDRALAIFAAEIGVTGGLHAWPRLAAHISPSGVEVAADGAPSGADSANVTGHWVLPGHRGPMAPRPDGSRIEPGPRLFHLSEVGLTPLPYGR